MNTFLEFVDNYAINCFIPMRLFLCDHDKLQLLIIFYYYSENELFDS